ncbi:DUF3376 domain-containing protein [Kocuria sp. M1R5S2]|uniref:DUF3376 domain-containing protein n=1 Tax=Kocuria rhizosphaerae TaxID=3376285 RepID=UPI00379B638F
MTSPPPGSPPGSGGLRLSVLGPAQRLADAAAGRPPAFGRTLRFALAMRGGVSLAVWIGGAVAELDVLRRIRIHRDGDGSLHAFLLHPSGAPDTRLAERAAVYAGLLADAGYDRVEFDILAGASAGGLNSVVHAVAQRAGADLSALNRLWAEHGALSRLLQPLGPRPVDSLLRGDEYLWPKLLAVLRDLHTTTEHHPDLVADHVTVELSATILDSDASADTAVAEGRGEFHFSSPEPGSPTPPPDNGIPRRGADPGRAADALNRLAYAARTTASLPGAFEPAAVWSAPTPGARQAPGPSAGRPDLGHAFGSHRDPAALPYRVVDGGVFDNVPIDRAMAAAVTRSSARYADRCLLYLDPDPPAPREGPLPDRGLPRLVPTLVATASRIPRREYDDDEVLALSETLSARLVADGRRQTLTAVAGPWTPDALAERRRAYIRYRGRADGDLLGGLLTRPSVWQLTSTLARRDALRARPPAELGALRDELLRRCDALSGAPLDHREADGLLHGPQALFDAASCVLSWVRSLEELALGGVRTPPAGPGTAQARVRAYRVLAVARHERDRQFHAVLAATADPDTPLTSAVDAWLARGGDAASGPVLARAWGELDAVVGELLARHPAVSTAPAGGAEAGRGAATWSASPWSRVPASSGDLRAADLPPFLSAAGIPASVSRVGYGEIRGDRPPARPEEFPVLQDALARDRLQSALEAEGGTARELARLLGPGDGRMPARAKLASAGLLNFRGFLSTEWRQNDWWWGRMDAAAGAVEVLRELPGRVERPAAEPHGGFGAGPPGPGRAEGPAGDVVAAVQETLLRERGHGSAERGRAGLVAGADGLGRLHPSYRLSLASRGLRVLGRALAATPGLPRAVREAALLLLQPLLVLVPVAVAPVRAAVVAVAVTAGLWAAAGPSRALPPGEQWTPLSGTLVLLSATVVVLVLAGTGMRAVRRWGAVLAAAPRAPDPGRPPVSPAPAPAPEATISAEEIAAARHRALGRAAVLAAAAAALFLPFTASVAHRHGAAAVALFVGVLLLGRLAAAAAVTVPGSTLPETVRAAVVLLGAVAVWCAAVAGAAWTEGAGILGAPASAHGRAAALGAALLVAGTVLLSGWVRTGWALALSLAAAGLGAAAAWSVWLWAGGPGQGWSDVVAVAAAAPVWAWALWWGPVERMLRVFDPDAELTSRR